MFGHCRWMKFLNDAAKSVQSEHVSDFQLHRWWQFSASWKETPFNHECIFIDIPIVAFLVGL